MKIVNQTIYKEMSELGLLKPEVQRDECGRPIKVMDYETGRMRTLIHTKYQVGSPNKASNAKSYNIDISVYIQYINFVDRHIRVSKKILKELFELGLLKADSNVNYVKTKHFIFVKNSVYNEYAKFL